MPRIPMPTGAKARLMPCGIELRDSHDWNKTLVVAGFLLDGKDKRRTAAIVIKKCSKDSAKQVASMLTEHPDGHLVYATVQTACAGNVSYKFNNAVLPLDIVMLREVNDSDDADKALQEISSQADRLCDAMRPDGMTPKAFQVWLAMLDYKTPWNPELPANNTHLTTVILYSDSTIRDLESEDQSRIPIASLARFELIRFVHD